MVVFESEPAGALAAEASACILPGAPARYPIKFKAGTGEKMDPASVDGMPSDVLVVEDDPIIALDYEDTILAFGVKTVRTAATVAGALELIDQRHPEFALLDVGLIREKSFAVAERLDALGIPYAFITGYGADGILPAEFAAKARRPKPCSSDALQAILKSRANTR